MRRRGWIVVLVLSSGVASCDAAQGAGNTRNTRQASVDSARSDSLARARQDSINRTLPGYVVDSALPVAEELRRFRAAVGGTAATQLEHASGSREELVRRFVSDLASGDTTDMRSALVSPREFADLIYPSSPYTHPPFKQAPGFLWSQIQNPSESGFTRVVRRRARQGLQYVDHRCKPKPEKQGSNRLWLGCTVRLASPSGDTTTQRLFGTIVERTGRFKFMSFTNQF